MDERMIKLMEEQNALLREMNGKLDDIMRGVALNGLGNVNFKRSILTEDSIDFLENKGDQKYNEKSSYY